MIASTKGNNEMNYSELSQDVKDFFIKDYSEKAQELREKAANPRARKAAEFAAKAEEFEMIVKELEAA